jgi:FdhD protein
MNQGVGSNVEGDDERIEKVRITRIVSGKREQTEDLVVSEEPLTIVLNGQKVITLLCTPRDQEYLALGFVLSEGFIHERKEIGSIDSHRKGEISITAKTKGTPSSDLSRSGIMTSGCAKGMTFSRLEDLDPAQDLLIDLQVTLSASEVQALTHEFEKKSVLFRKTGGVHAAAVASPDRILVYFEDIGRHNAVDKVLGKCFLEDITCEDKILLLSGRISSDVLAKAAKSGLSIIVSRSAPTASAVKGAEKLGITLVGFARGSKMNVYSFPMRITS